MKNEDNIKYWEAILAFMNKAKGHIEDYEEEKFIEFMKKRGFNNIDDNISVEFHFTKDRYNANMKRCLKRVREKIEAPKKS